MGITLITGAGGFIGSALLEEVAKDGGEVLGMSRTNKGSEDVVRGDFASYEDLRLLDGYDIDRLCHLGAVTGSCTERDGMAVNVAGTRALLRYLLDRGCRKFVLASSIAAIGLADANFVPEAVPIGDDHPCWARDAYGLSKYLMERVGEYFSRVSPGLEVTALRLASVFPDASPPPKCDVGTKRGPYALAKLTRLCLSDALLAFKAALNVELGPGFRVLNATPSKSWSAVPTRVILGEWFGEAVDASWFTNEDNEYDCPFDSTRAKKMTGFDPCC